MREELLRQMASFLCRGRVLPGYGQAEFAQMLGMDQSQLSRLEHGHKNPTWLTLARVLGVLDLRLVGIPATPGQPRIDLALPPFEVRALDDWWR